MNNMSLWQILRVGERYMAIWPQQLKPLSLLFPEHNFIRLLKITLHMMPPFAVFLLSWCWIMHCNWIVSVSSALFALSIPLQGFWLLGHRANTVLPAGLIEWYREIKQQLQRSGYATSPNHDILTYQHLAELLQQATKQLDQTFWQEW